MVVYILNIQYSNVVPFSIILKIFSTLLNTRILKQGNVCVRTYVSEGFSMFLQID